MADTNSPQAPRRARAADRRKQAVALRVAGATFAQIGERLGITAPAAYKLVTQALKQVSAETAEHAEQLRQMEIARLDAMQAAVWGDAVKGDVQAVLCVLKVMTRRAQLLGLDAPTRSEHLMSWRDEAKARGVDPDAVVAAVEKAMTASGLE